MAIKWTGLLVLTFCVSVSLVTEARRLNQFVRYFEPLSYPPYQVHRDHVRHRRDTVQRWTASPKRNRQASFRDRGETKLPDSRSHDEEGTGNASVRILPVYSRRVCNLKVSVDHLMYEHMYRGEQNPSRTRARITALIASHVNRASAVYRRTSFGGIQDISFIVQKIRINDSRSCAEGVKEDNPFCSDGIDAGYLLHLTSKENNDDFCLAYTWTFRDFADGILGLAWIARAQLGQGGICEKNRPSVDQNPGTTEFRQFYLSLNSGIMTFLNYNSPVSQAVSEITFCHEIGHNFGSPPLMHDILLDALPAELRHLSAASSSSPQPYDDLCAAVLARYGETYRPLPGTRDGTTRPAAGSTTATSPHALEPAIDTDIVTSAVGPPIAESSPAMSNEPAFSTSTLCTSCQQELPSSSKSPAAEFQAPNQLRPNVRHAATMTENPEHHPLGPPLVDQTAYPLPATQADNPPAAPHTRSPAPTKQLHSATTAAPSSSLSSMAHHTEISRATSICSARLAARLQSTRQLMQQPHPVMCHRQRHNQHRRRNNCVARPSQLRSCRRTSKHAGPDELRLRSTLFLRYLRPSVRKNRQHHNSLSEFLGPLPISTSSVSLAPSNSVSSSRPSPAALLPESPPRDFVISDGYVNILHDSPPGVSCYGACAPCGARGNYIMFPSATKGSEFNNDKFSPCSIRNITNVLKPMFEGRSNRENCFQVDGGPICGNDIVEEDEECDCGFFANDCQEKCCYPRHNTLGAPGCTLRKGKDCSPSAGPCCSTECRLHDSSVMCSTDNLCRNYGLKDCTLAGSEYTVDELCLLACEGPSGGCLPACDFPSMKAHCGVTMTPGSPCNALRGYCDVFRKCRDVDAEGPLARLQRIFFGEKSVNKIKEFISIHPLLSVFLALGSLWLMIVVFRCLAVHTPTSNPNKKPAHKLKDTLKQPWKL
ncbi:hypothetical protein HPB52_019028 [Rhipicephalus sanguineus]|uniref:ADAM10 endopeptidase n=1 Tax=Rhipicephalus sanguineus TaxID=34632 RepID=A0A9D4Q7J5_RHISA|nr:hypothetical protein HPB52_019028 [Rhipicephalus sanguineus]